MTNSTPVCDYEGSDYRTRFWENQGRDYEDQAERLALRRLMPPTGDRLIEIGAGFGRLANEYLGYNTVVLFDYSRSLLREAQQHLGDDPRFVYVAGNWYDMPFVDAAFDTQVQIRTLHHAADVPTLFKQLARIARPNGRYVLEFANKQNLKATLRYWLGRQTWSPFTPEPFEFTELNFNFHPRYIHAQLQTAGFSPEQQLAVSHFRVPLLKRLVPTKLLAGLDGALQGTGRWWQMTPSMFVSSAHPGSNSHTPSEALFACPTCQASLPKAANGLLVCPKVACGQRWRVDNGLYDFKSPV